MKESNIFNYGDWTGINQLNFDSMNSYGFDVVSILEGMLNKEIMEGIGRSLSDLTKTQPEVEEKKNYKYILIGR